jgi:hypothetical protein
MRLRRYRLAPGPIALDHLHKYAVGIQEHVPFTKGIVPLLRAKQEAANVLPCVQETRWEPDTLRIPSVSAAVHAARNVLATAPGDVDAETRLLLTRAQWLTAAQSTGILYAWTIDRLLGSTLLLAHDIQYWESIERSRLNGLHYFVQTLPLRVFTSLSFKDIVQKMQDEALHNKEQCIQARELSADRLGQLTEALQRALEQLPVKSDLQGLDKVVGSMTRTMLNTPASMDSLAEVVQALEHIAHQLPPLHTNNAYARPNILVRSWFAVLIGVLAITSISSGIYSSRQAITTFSHEAKETLIDFIHDWIVVPVEGMYQTIRHEEKRLSIIGEHALEADTASLERMVVEFAQDVEKKPLDPQQIAQLIERAREGDISIVLQAYEQDIKSPIQSAMRGSLLRTLLIQVQKIKVDVDLVMSTLDKLLRANELNFAFLALVPSLLAVYFGAKGARNVYWRLRGLGAAGAGKDIRYTLWSISRILNQQQGACTRSAHGLVLCEAHLLRHRSKKLKMPTIKRDMWEQDVRELEGADEHVKSVGQRLRTIARMHHTYEFLLPK